MLERLRARLLVVARILRTTAGPRAAWGAMRVAAQGRGADSSPEQAVAIPMRALGGEPIWVRPRSSDLANAIAYYVESEHRPPPGVENPSTIVELGSNCGVALTALAHEYPNARLLGAEPDPGNVEMAQRNVARFGGRAEVVQAAIWDETTELTVDRSSPFGEHGFSVRPSAPDDPPEWPRLNGTTVDDLFAAHLDPDQVVDYMHMTIEGTEPRVLAAGGAWPERVRAIKVELHIESGFGADECVAALEALGYRAWILDYPPLTFGVGVRE